MKSKLLSILALLLTAVTQGAWAQTDLTPMPTRPCGALPPCPPTTLTCMQSTTPT